MFTEEELGMINAIHDLGIECDDLDAIATYKEMMGSEM